MGVNRTGSFATLALAGILLALCAASAAAQAAWPRMLRFLKEAFGEPVSMSGSVWLPAAGFSAIDSCPCGDEPNPKLVASLSEGRVD